MKKVFTAILGMFFPLFVSAETGSKPLSKSNFSLSAELNTKYVWRGLEYGNSPLVFGTLGYDYKGFNAYVLGGYATNGDFREVVAGLSYSDSHFTFGVSDFFYPTIPGEKDNFVQFDNHKTGHLLETFVTVRPFDKVPVWMTLSSFVFGNDKRADGKQAYSSYVELGYTHSFSGNNSISLSAGANLNKSFYTDYDKGFNVTNITAKYTTGISFGKFTLPISGSFIYNPIIDKPYFSMSFYLSSKG